MKVFNYSLLILSFWITGVQAGLTLKDEARAFDLKTKNSHSPLFMNISGWMNKGLLVHKRVNLNQAIERSPDADELKSVENSFDINYALFFTDSEFQCRRPSYYKYFSDLLRVKPFENSGCRMNHQVTLISESASGGSPMVARDIDPARIYQIHYLFAGKGKEMMSRWGHAMFRLVLCAPGKVVGPDCLNDYAQHVVVSYRANVEDMNIDYTKGMNGAYASQLFLMNMSEVVAEYTKGEFRDMISLPMKMSRAEINHFTDKLLENYWSYKGRYFFMTNNCATEAMNLLRTAYPENILVQTANIVSPLGLYDFLVKNKITSTDILDDRKEAIRKGNLFPGVSDKLQKSLDMFIGDNKLSFEDFALKLKPIERREYYSKKMNETDKPSILLANALRLEEQILLSREQLFAKKIGNALFGKDPMPELKNTILNEKIIEMKNLYKKLTDEGYLAPGYGIPLEDEFKVASIESIKSVLEEIQSNMEELKQIAFKFFPLDVEDMKQTMENRSWILEQISKEI
jgi:hypothetical protein